ncbi:MAG: AAA family ATPase [Anaerovoracaceae bacterium]
MTIKNFMSIRNETLDFGDITVLTGASDSGKSAICKAIVWTLFNTPSGTWFIRDIIKRDAANEPERSDIGELVMTKSGVCHGEVHFNDGSVIIRRKSVSINEYKLILPNGEETLLTGFGAGPVDEVVKFHGMREVEYLNRKGSYVNSLNVIPQFLDPFFLSESPISRAVIIGDMAKTEIVDLAIKNTASSVREKKRDEKRYKAEIKATKEEIKNYKNLGKMNKDIVKVTSNLEKMKAMQTKSDSLVKIKESYSKNMVKLIDKETLIKNRDSIDEVCINASNLSESHSKLMALENINSKYNGCKSRLREAENTINSFNETDILTVTKACDSILNNASSIRKLNTISKSYKDAYLRLKECNDIIENGTGFDNVIKHADECLDKLRTVNELSSLSTKYIGANFRFKRQANYENKENAEFCENMNEYRDALKQYPHCPICSSEISDDVIQNIQL